MVNPTKRVAHQAQLFFYPRVLFLICYLFFSACKNDHRKVVHHGPSPPPILNPTLKFTSPSPEFATNTHGLNLTGSCKDGPNIDLSGDIEGGPVATCSRGNFTTTVTLNSGDGRKSITATQTGTSDNSESATLIVFVDTVSPVLRINSPPDNYYFNERSLSLSGHCESGPEVILSGDIEGSSTATCSEKSFTTTVTLNAGDETKSITATQTDTAGNGGNDMVNVVLNTSPSLEASNEYVFVSSGAPNTYAVDLYRSINVNLIGVITALASSVDIKTDVNFEWVQIKGPPVTLQDADTLNPHFDSPPLLSSSEDVDLIFELRASHNGDTLSTRSTIIITPRDFFPDFWNDILTPEEWDSPSNPYTCLYGENISAWVDTGLIDLGGQDSLSLIRFYGNGSYLRYNNMVYSGCTQTIKYSYMNNYDSPADPKYYSVGNIDIYVDIARIPLKTNDDGEPVPHPQWYGDQGVRYDMTMLETVQLLNEHISPYYKRISQNKFNITFHEGNDFNVGGDENFSQTLIQQLREAGINCANCEATLIIPGAINRILFIDIISASTRSHNGWAVMGLNKLRYENISTIVHEIGHGWMNWPHSFTALPSNYDPGGSFSAQMSMEMPTT